MQQDVNFLLLLWEITIGFIAAISTIYAWHMRRQARQWQTIDNVDKRVICMEEKLKTFPTKTALTRLAGEVRSLGQLLERIERSIERMEQSLHEKDTPPS